MIITIPVTFSIEIGSTGLTKTPTENDSPKNDELLIIFLV